MLLQSTQSTACTTFLIKRNGQLVFGRNYDWVTGSGFVTTNLSGLSKSSLQSTDKSPLKWTSKYGSITFNQYGKEFPTGGMNETGLVVELMWADGTQYPEADERPALGVLQWIQFQLDNYSTVAEVLSSDRLIRISQDNPPLHYLVADAQGNAAAIEFYGGRLTVHTGKDLPFPVLTNSTYEQSAKSVTTANFQQGNSSFDFQDNSLQRFAKACSMIRDYNVRRIDVAPVDYAFSILENVSQQGFTKWSIVYDIANRRISFRTDGYQEIRNLPFESFRFDCNSGSKVLDINQHLQGNVASRFVPFTDSFNRKVLEVSVAESKPQIEISRKSVDEHLALPSAFHCK
jgi:choloylglycine hydrolase